MSAGDPRDPVPDPRGEAAPDSTQYASPDSGQDADLDSAQNAALESLPGAPPEPVQDPASDDRDPRPDDAEKPRGRAYRADGITVYFDARACWHTGDCLRGLPHVFDVRRRPWVRADLDTPERIAAQVRACPSGALSYDRHDDEA